MLIYDEDTLLKLKIFREYFRSWLGVFLARQSVNEIFICDYFSGPGMDSKGAYGSPLILASELNSFLDNPRFNRLKLKTTVRFNDLKRGKIAALKSNIASHIQGANWDSEFSAIAFEDALKEDLPKFQDKNIAALLIADQFGIKEMTESIFKQLSRCPKTDVLFFVSSSIIRRFINHPSIRRYIKVDQAAIKSIPHTEIHRFLCHNYYQRLVDIDREYHVAPFSIRKGKRSNIYGIIFGSSSLLGLEKFLEVCWRVDSNTGEANYNIDMDLIWEDGDLFDDASTTISKFLRFESDLKQLIETQKANNCTISRFALENGFLPKHAARVLKSMQDEGKLRVEDYVTGSDVQKGAFYLTKDFYSVSPKIRLIPIGSFL